jgi:hypothetical protein
VKACPIGWVGYEELLVRTGRASSNAVVFAVSQRESHEQGFGGEAFGGSPSAIGLRYVVGDKRILSKLALFGYRVDSLEERLVGPPTGV